MKIQISAYIKSQIYDKCACKPTRKMLNTLNLSADVVMISFKIIIPNEAQFHGQFFL